MHTLPAELLRREVRVLVVGCGGNGSRGELRDRDVIRMSVGAVGPERHDGIGAHSSEMPDNLRDNLPRVDAIEMLVVMIEQGHFTHAQRRCRSAELRLADRREGRRARMLTRISAPRRDILRARAFPKRSQKRSARRPRDRAIPTSIE